MARYKFSGANLGVPASYTLLDENGNEVRDQQGQPIHPASVPGANDFVEGGQAGMSGTATFRNYDSRTSATLTAGTLTAHEVRGLAADGGVIEADDIYAASASKGGRVEAEYAEGATASTNGTIIADRIDGGASAATGGTITVGELISTATSGFGNLVNVGAGGTISATNVYSAAGMQSEVKGGTFKVANYNTLSLAGLSDRLAIREGGTVRITGEAAFGKTANSSSTLEIDGTNSTLVYESPKTLVFGDQGQSSVRISNNASVTWSSVVAGKTFQNNRSDGQIYVETGGSMHVLHDLFIGHGTKGYLTVGATASVQVDGGLFAAVQASGNAYLKIAGGTLNVHGNVLLSDAGTIAGFDGVTGGGTMTVDGDFSMARKAGSYASLRVGNAGSLLELGAAATIGNGGEGRLRVDGGAEIDASRTAILLGRNAGAFGTLEVNGRGDGGDVFGGTRMTAKSILVGFDGNGYVGVDNRGELTVSSELRVGGTPTSSVGVSGGTLNAKGTVTLGTAKGNGTLNVSASTDAKTGAIYAGTVTYAKDILVGAQKEGYLGISSADAASRAIVKFTASGTGNIDIGKNGVGSVGVFGAGSELDARTMTVGGQVATEEGSFGQWTYSGGTGRMVLGNGGYVSVLKTLTLRGGNTDSFEYQLTIDGGAGLEVGGNSGRRADELRIDAGGTLIGNGQLSVGPFANGEFAGRIVNNGVLEADDGTLYLRGQVSGKGETRIGAHSTLKIDGSFSGKINFESGTGSTLVLEDPDPSTFKGVIGDLSAGNTIRLRLADLPAQVSHAEIAKSTLVVTFANGEEWRYKLDAGYSRGTFTVKTLGPEVVGGSGRVDLTFQADNPQVRTGVDGTPSNNDYLDSLIAGWAAWDPDAGPITYCFGSKARLEAAALKHGDTATLDHLGPVAAWTEKEKDAYRDALDVYASATGLTFKETSSAAKANIVAWQTLLGGDTVGQSEDLATMPNGQLWQYFDPSAASWTKQDFGASGRYTLIHEMGHALGLAHPHDGGGQPDRSTFPGVDAGQGDDAGKDGQNQTVFTVMSYVRGWNGVEEPDSAFGHQGGLGAFDIAALQLLYGKNNKWHKGDDTYRLPTANEKGTGWQAIWDADGEDTISAGRTKLDCRIDLNEAPLKGKNAGGFISFADEILGGFTIAKGAEIENASGGRGDDRLTGNDLANKLLGNAGKDVLFGGDGVDRLNGGLGADELRGGDGKDLFIFTDVADSTVKASGQDTIFDFGDGDRFDLRDIDANTKKKDDGDQKFSFIKTAKFHGKAGELRYEKEKSDTYVYADTNGDKKTDFAFHLDDAVTLVKADFLL